MCEVKKGDMITKETSVKGEIPVIAGGQQPAYYHNKSNREAETITISASGAYAGFVNYFNIPIFASDCSTVRVLDKNKVLIRYIYYLLKAKQEDIYNFQKGGAQPHVYPKDLLGIKVPLPDLETQKQLIARFDKQEDAIKANKALIEVMQENINEKISEIWSEDGQ